MTAVDTPELMMMISVGLSFSGASLVVSRLTRVDKPDRWHRTGIVVLSQDYGPSSNILSISAGKGHPVSIVIEECSRANQATTRERKPTPKAVREWQRDREITR